MRTKVTSFNKAISTGSVTTKVLVLQPSASGSLTLSNSSFIIVIGHSNVLNITLINKSGESQIFEEVGFLMLHASNLDSILIQNTSIEEHEIEIVF